MRRQAAASKAAAAEAKAAAEKAKAKAKAKEAAEQKQMQVTAAKKRADAAKKAAAKSKSIAAKKAAAKAAKANEAAAKKEAAEKAAKKEAEEAAAESDAAKAAAKKAKACQEGDVVGQGLSAAGPMQSGGAGKTSNKLPERGAAASGVLHFAANSIVVCSICKACMATPQRCKELLCFNYKTPLLLLPLPLPRPRPVQSRIVSRPKSVRRALLTPQVNPGPLCCCGQSTSEQSAGYGRSGRGPHIRVSKTTFSQAHTRFKGRARSAARSWR